MNPSELAVPLGWRGRSPCCWPQVRRRNLPWPRHRVGRAADRCKRSSAGQVGGGARLAAAGRGAGRLAARRATWSHRNDAGRCGRGGRRGQGRQVRLPYGAGTESVVAGRLGPIDAAGSPRRLQPARLRTRAPQRRHVDRVDVGRRAEWTKRYDNQGKHFGGISGQNRWRWRSHPANSGRGSCVCRSPARSRSSSTWTKSSLRRGRPGENLALHKPADQSSISIWSTSKLIGPPPAGR